MHISAISCLTLLLAAGPGIADERQGFLAAEAALQLGDRSTFERLTAGLEDYPLYPYLRFASLKRRLGRASTTEVEQFLREQADTPLAGRIRRAWLDRLVKRGRWQDYLRVYRPDSSTERRCHYLRALIETGRADEALEQVEPLWLVSGSQPTACDPVFNAWRKAGRLTDELTWDRIRLAMADNRTRLAAYLGRFLSMGERIWLDRWLEVHRHPELVLDADISPPGHPQQGQILAHGIRRLARKSPRLAADALDRIPDSYDLAPGLLEQAKAATGLALVEQQDRRGLDYLDSVVPCKGNMALQERRLRAALGLRAWPQVDAWVEAMPEGEQKSEHWLYWQARASEAMGETKRASDLYARAALERSLWGLLAAERTGSPYRLGHQPTPVTKERITALEQGPAGRRTQELHALGRRQDLRRELYHLSLDLGERDLQALAILAGRWNMPDQAILFLAKSGYWDDLELRFPIRYRNPVRDRARATGLAESLIYAVLRQESAFNPEALSPAGAVGLMQLMPATARSVARSLGLPRPNRSALLDPDRNITLGSSYLARMKKRFGGNPALAAAAYNAGPHRVSRWLSEEPMDADIWIATIPFNETRGYVRRVLAYRVFYDYRLGRKIAPLSKRLGPISRSVETAP